MLTTLHMNVQEDRSPLHILADEKQGHTMAKALHSARNLKVSGLCILWVMSPSTVKMMMNGWESRALYELYLACGMSTEAVLIQFLLKTKMLRVLEIAIWFLHKGLWSKILSTPQRGDAFYKL